jgi:hypothetical protein
MLLENYIKLLLEAPQTKLGDLMKHPGKVLVGKNYHSYWEFANAEFKSFHANEDLSKRGPFFNCMKLCFDEFLSYENDPEFDVAEHLLSMVVYINGLYDFKNNPEVNKVYTSFIADGYNGFEELKVAYENIFQHIGPKNLNSFGNPSYLNLLKTSQTEYLFDTPDKTMNGVLAVVPTTTASSIFWARTNANAQQIILTKLDRSKHGDDEDFLTWCTSFPDESNMFHSYYVNGGTSLFYFLPIDDVQGLNKFCIGITKIIDANSDDPNDFRLLCGGHTTVGFENHAFITDGSDFTDDDVKQMMINKFGPLGLTMEMLNVIEEKVSGRNPFDKYSYVGNLKAAEFAASINMNTIGSTEDGRKTIKRQIETILFTYEDPEFLKNYQPNPKIMQVINKDIRYWTECNVDTRLIPERLGDNLDFWVNNTIKNSEKDISYSESGISIENFIDWNFKKRPNIVTADFVIEFIEKCFDRSVQEGKYDPDDQNIRRDRYEKIAKSKSESAALNEEYSKPYDKIVLNLKISLVSLEVLMKWSQSEIAKFFQYIQKVKNSYPIEVIVSSNKYKYDTSFYDYFLRRLSKNGDTYDQDSYSDSEYRSIKIFSSQLLKTLFNNFNDFKNFYILECKKGRSWKKESLFNLSNFLMFDNSRYSRYKPFLIPSEWITPNIIEKEIIYKNEALELLRNDKNSSSDIIIKDLDQFKKDNHLIFKKIVSNILKTEFEEIFEEYEKTEDANVVLQSSSIKFIENILKDHADIIQELQESELNDPSSDFAKFNNLFSRVIALKNRGFNTTDDFHTFITSAAAHCRYLIDNEPKEVGEFSIKFLDELSKKLENSGKSLSTFENSFFMAAEFKKYNVEFLNFGQFYFWIVNFKTQNTLIEDPHEWARFFYEIYEGNMSFSLLDIAVGYSFEIEDAVNLFRRIKTGVTSVSNIEKKIISTNNLKSFINCEMFKSIISSLEDFAIYHQDKKFFTIMMQKLYNDYFNSDLNRFINFCLVFFKENKNNQTEILTDLTEKFLINLINDPSELTIFKNFNAQKGIDETNMYRDKKRSSVQNKNIEDEDDNLDEAVKFKIGQNILTESQLRKLIRHLL